MRQWKTVAAVCLSACLPSTCSCCLVVIALLGFGLAARRERRRDVIGIA